MLTFFSLLAIVLLFKFVFFFYIGFFFHDLLPRFQLKFSKQVCTYTYSKSLPVYILIKTVINTEIKSLTL